MVIVWLVPCWVHVDPSDDRSAMKLLSERVSLTQ